VELLLKELKSHFGLDEINTTDPYLIEALILIAAISLIMSRVIVDELQKLDAQQRESADDAVASSTRVPRGRGSTIVERHSHLIYLYVMLDLGYDLPNLDALLLGASRDPNPHRPRLLRTSRVRRLLVRIRLMFSTVGDALPTSGSSGAATHSQR
jgi:hypothetical protein